MTWVAMIPRERRCFTERPRACQRRDDLAPGLRQAVHGGYLILFTTGGDAVVIERVLHGARRLEDLL